MLDYHSLIWLLLQKSHELLELDLPRAVLIDIWDQFLYVNGHLEFMFDDIDQFLRIDGALLIILPA